MAPNQVNPSLAAAINALIQVCQQNEQKHYPIMSKKPYIQDPSSVNYNLLCHTGGRIKAKVSGILDMRNTEAPVYNLH